MFRSTARSISTRSRRPRFRQWSRNTCTLPTPQVWLADLLARAGLREVRLIHGRGIGVQRARVQQVLRAHPLVEGYGDAPESHMGATVVRLKGSSITETQRHKDAQGQ